ncbi:MAG: hypothetical protein OQK70_08215 [Gammaproteobacteria bacterium]|nr:hypothetical protein [Gammaproteobacteria bacterium]
MNHIFKHLIHLFDTLSSARKLTTIACFLLFLFTSHVNAEDNHAFLITGSSSKTTSVSLHDVRRIYLGGTAIEAVNIENPVLNKADHNTYKLFLKNVMHMTEGGYKRKVIKRIFRQGSDKIKAINDLRELDQHFKEHPNDICYISEKDHKHLINTKIIRPLW